jgi:hypothetical protein
LPRACENHDSRQAREGNRNSGTFTTSARTRVGHREPPALAQGLPPFQPPSRRGRPGGTDGRDGAVGLAPVASGSTVLDPRPNGVTRDQSRLSVEKDRRHQFRSRSRKRSDTNFDPMTMRSDGCCWSPRGIGISLHSGGVGARHVGRIMVVGSHRTKNERRAGVAGHHGALRAAHSKSVLRRHPHDKSHPAAVKRRGPAKTISRARAVRGNPPCGRFMVANRSSPDEQGSRPEGRKGTGIGGRGDTPLAGWEKPR